MFTIDDPGDYRRIRDTLAAAGYDDAGVAELVGGGSPTAKRLAVLLRRTGGGSPLETLVRLFVLGTAVPAEDAERALAPAGPAWWAGRGLVACEGGQVSATVHLRPYQGLVLAFDFSPRPGMPLASDHVMGISASSLTLAGLTIRRPAAAAMDLGTGSGFQAFLAAQHSERVVATDANLRAVEIAAFNAGLNELPHVDCRQGDLFEPVDGETFDLIVSNPPFVVSPDDRYLFLHRGTAGDDVCRAIVTEAPRHLSDGGYCQLLANWISVEGEDWRTRLAGWFEGTGCDGWVLRRESQSPEDYASTWIEADGGEDDFGRAFDGWMAYYEDLGVKSINSGVITMRRGTAGRSPWFRADDAPDTMTFPAGGDIARSFEVQDFLAGHGGDDLLAVPLRLADDVRLDQQSQPLPPGWETVGSRIRRTRGLHWSGGIDSRGARALARCDGTRPMAEVLGDLANELGDDAEELASSWTGIVRRLVEQGFLLPASLARGSVPS